MEAPLRRIQDSLSVTQGIDRQMLRRSWKKSNKISIRNTTQIGIQPAEDQERRGMTPDLQTIREPATDMRVIL